MSEQGQTQTQDQTQDQAQEQGGFQSFLGELPLDRLKEEAKNGLGNLKSSAFAAAGNRITDATGRLKDIAEGGGDAPVVGEAVQEGAEAASEGKSPVMGAIKGGLTGVKDKVKSAVGGGGGGNKATKSTNIVESIDVGVPVSVAYNAWTEFQKWSGFMKKLEHAERQDDEAKVDFKAQVFWSHRQWEATILEEVPDDRIVWRSKGEKGHVDGAVTFHELAPRLTRILVVLEYYPQGFMERTGNLWRAQGRRARLELKHFRRHVMTRTILEPEEVEGWRGEIRDGEVVEPHDEALEREQQEAQDEDQETGAEAQEPESSEDEYDDEYEDEEEEPEASYEEDEEEPEEEYEEGEEPEEGYEDEPVDEDVEEAPAEEEEPAPQRRSGRRRSR